MKHKENNMTKPIEGMRRRNTQGVNTVPLTITLPKELTKLINSMVTETTKSRSLIITELIEKGLKK